MSAPTSLARRVVTLLELDAKLALRHNLLTVVVVIAVLFGALIRFALPDTLEHESRDFVLDASEGQRLVALAERAGLDPTLLDSPDELRQAVADEPNSLGIMFEGSPAAPRATVFIQGDESPERLALIATGVDLFWRLMSADEATLAAWPQPTVLDPGAQKPPFNEAFIPLLFAVDLALLGFMFGAVMVLQDKQSGTLSVYRVGPAGATEYLLSKLGINLALSLLNLLLLVGIGAPHLLGLPALYPLVLLTCGGMTLAGMGLAVLFRSISQFFVPLIAVGLLGAMPMYLVFSPSAALDWTWWLPTYHVLFGAEALLFDGDPEVVRAALIYAALFMLVSTIFCATAFSRRLLREVSK